MIYHPPPPRLLGTVRVDESIKGMVVGNISSIKHCDIIIVTYSGKIISFVSDIKADNGITTTNSNNSNNKNNSNNNNNDTNSNDKEDMKKQREAQLLSLRNEVAELREKVEKQMIKTASAIAAATTAVQTSTSLANNNNKSSTTTTGNNNNKRASLSFESSHYPMQFQLDAQVNWTLDPNDGAYNVNIYI